MEAIHREYGAITRYIPTSMYLASSTSPPLQLSVEKYTDYNPDSMPVPLSTLAGKSKTADSLFKGMGTDSRKGSGSGANDSWGDGCG